MLDNARVAEHYRVGRHIYIYIAVGAMRTSSPIVMPPTIAALIPIHTSLPMVGTPLFFPRFV